jgi:hypothetical protein
MRFFRKACVPLLVVFLVVSFSAAQQSSAQDANVKAATKAAQDWLAVVDAGDYGKSWDEASEFFQKRVTKQQWEQMVSQVRTPVGKLQSRQFKSAAETVPPGAPPGKYVTLQFNTKFATVGDAVETLFLMLDNGKWKVAGYFVKPPNQ